MKKRSIVVATVAVVLGAGWVASAHEDFNPDQQKCDTWWRHGHGTGTNQDKYPSHEHKSSSDIPLGDPANTEVHGQSGHYVVRNDYGYVEVIGGQSYRGPHPNGKSFPGQGGIVQGEVDAAEGAPDVDFNIAAFGPNVDQPPAADPAAIQAWAGGTYAAGCLNVANTQIEQQSRQP